MLEGALSSVSFFSLSKVTVVVDKGGKRLELYCSIHLQSADCCHKLSDNISSDKP